MRVGSRGAASSASASANAKRVDALAPDFALISVILGDSR
jgi:hypothetical protein